MFDAKTSVEYVDPVTKELLLTNELPVINASGTTIVELATKNFAYNVLTTDTFEVFTDELACNLFVCNVCTIDALDVLTLELACTELPKIPVVIEMVAALITVLA